MSERGEEMASSLPVPDHLLAEILLRLPTPADLIRASAACVSFSHVIAGRSFVRRFRKLHAPPLLGFLNPYGNLDNIYDTRFSHPAVAPHPSASAASAFAHAADFTFSFLPGPSLSLFWVIRDIRDERVLLDKSFRLSQMSFAEMVVCDPLHRRYLQLPPVPRDPSNVRRRGHLFVEAFLAPPPAADDEEETSFRVVWMGQSEAKVFSFVFSSASGQWRPGPSLSCSELFASLSSEPTSVGLFSSRHYACGCFYWLADSTGKMLVLDTQKMEFSVAESPPGAKYHNAAMVEAGGGNPGMFVLDHETFNLSYSIRRNHGHGGSSGTSGQWQSDKTISLGSRYAIIGSSERYLFLYRYGTSSLEPGCFTMDVETFQLEQVCPAAKYENGVPDLRAYVNFPPSVLAPPTVLSGVEDKAEETLEQGCAASSNA